MLKMSSALLLLSLLFAVMDYVPTTKGFVSDTSIPIRRSFSPRKNNNHPTYSIKNINIRSSLLFSTTAKNVEKELVTTPNETESTSFSMERKNDDQWHWVEDCDRENLRINYRNDDDENEEENRQGENNNNNNNSKQISKMRFKIHGNPRPLQRHRTSRGHMYNPSLKYQKSFLNAYQNLIFDDEQQHNIDDMNINNDYLYDDTPIFDATKYLAITIIFRMKRPKSHFINNKPGLGRIKKKAQSQLLPIRTDVDNLAKFVLDSMNGVLYEDDKQIMSIHATKLLDNVGLCEGSTEIYIRTINGDEDMEKIIESSISNIDI